MLTPLKSIRDARGCLTVAEKLPFDFKRAYWLTGIDPNAIRGGHAHRALRRLMVAVSGSFLARIDGEEIPLSHPSIGLFIEPMQWVELHSFSPNAVCLVLASEEHDEADCIRDRTEFDRLKGAS